LISHASTFRIAFHDSFVVAPLKLDRVGRIIPQRHAFHDSFVVAPLKRGIACLFLS